LLSAGLALMAGPAGSLRSGPALDGPAAADKKQPVLYTLTYDVRSLLQKPASLRATGLGRSKDDLTGIDYLVHLIHEAVSPECWQTAKGDGSFVRELNGGFLEVHTGKGQHEEIHDLLDALSRLTGIAVVVKSSLYEVDRALYEKEIEPSLLKSPSEPARRMATSAEGLPEKVLATLRKLGSPINSHRVKIDDCDEASCFSLRRAFVCRGLPAAGGAKPVHSVKTGFSGVSFRAGVVISADRRYVRIDIRQEVKELVELRKETVEHINDKGEEQEVVYDEPRYAESTTSTRLKMEDGATLLVPVYFRFPAQKEKDRVLLLVVQPTIWIAEEEKAHPARREG